MKILFEEWLPDRPSYQNPGLIQAKNTIPRAQGYSSLNNIQTFSGALTGACLGAFWLPDLSSTATNFAGDATKLYKYNNSTTAWADVSLGGGYSAATRWRFEKFGNRVIAVDIGQNPQYYDLATSSNFANLGGSPPKARYIATVRDFVVLGNITSLPYTVRWSAFNNSDLWTASLATQSDSQQLPGRGGAIQALVPGEYGVVFQQNSIWRMDYVGPPVVFKFDEVERGRGTPAPESVVWVGNLVFYYDWQGFHVFDGQSSQPIGNTRVDRWFQNNSGTVNSYSTMVGVADRKNSLIMWAFKSSDAQTYNDRIIMFNFATNKWSWGEVTTQYISERVAGEVDLDAVDAALGNPALGIDDPNNISMDSPFFGGDLNVQVFNAENKAGTFEGSALGATFETGDFSGDEFHMETQSIRPLVDAGTGAVRIAYRENLTNTATYTNTISLNRLGEACHRVNARYQRVELAITGGFDYCSGVEIRTRQAGRR